MVSKPINTHSYAAFPHNGYWYVGFWSARLYCGVLQWRQFVKSFNVWYYRELGSFEFNRTWADNADLAVVPPLAEQHMWNDRYVQKPFTFMEFLWEACPACAHKAFWEITNGVVSSGLPLNK
jgi:hypothetical protein